MCDYSLHGLNNRLAVTGETLVVHRFRTGSIGMAAEADVCPREEGSRRRWQWLLGLNRPAPKADCAVCIPPGATLMLRDIPQRLRHEFGIGESETVVFTQVTAAANAYRDAVRFRTGAEVLLQRLEEGQRVAVVNLSLAEPMEAPAETAEPVETPQAEDPASSLDQTWRSTNWA